MVGTKLSKVYDKLMQANITVEYIPFLYEEQAVSFQPTNDKFWIGLNPNLKLSEREELCVLMEEKAHYDVGIIPNDCKSNNYSDVLVREKNELKAKKYAVKQLIPREKLLNYIKSNYYIDINELADYFEVTPKFAKEALSVYGFN